MSSTLLVPFTKERVQYTLDTTTYRKLRVRASLVTRLRSFFIFPEFSVDNVWRGASEIIKEFRFSLDKNTSILDLFASAPENVNFVPCIAWKPTTETIVRYKLWNNVGEILWVPLYTGQNIKKDFSIEIWNTDSTPAIGGGYRIQLSTLTIPEDFCDTDDIQLGTEYEECTDVTFDLTDFAPIDGDYYIVVGDCGVTELIKGPVATEDFIIVKSSNDDTWHKISMHVLDGEVFVRVHQELEAPQVKEYYPMFWTDYLGVASVTPTKLQVRLLEGEYFSHIVGDVVDPAAVFSLSLLANDANFYALRIRQEADGIKYLRPAQTATIL